MRQPLVKLVIADDFSATYRIAADLFFKWVAVFLQ